MSNASPPGKPPQDPPAFEDIPIAERETVVEPVKKTRSLTWLWWLGGLSAIALLSAGGWFAYQASQNRPSEIAASPTASPSPTPAADGRLLGHYPYQEAPQSELEPITADGGIKLRSSAAKAFRNMEAAASAEGIILNPLSGFRSIKEQEQVYFDVKAEREQTPQERALVSAPPGHSEHHTGYAIDIGDGNVPATNLSPDFDKTPAFKWLQENAARFNFEISFPKDNKQGVSYEPWHWRFVGDKNSLETFYRAKEDQKQSSPAPSP